MNKQTNNKQQKQPFFICDCGASNLTIIQIIYYYTFRFDCRFRINCLGSVRDAPQQQQQQQHQEKVRKTFKLLFLSTSTIKKSSFFIFVWNFGNSHWKKNTNEQTNSGWISRYVIVCKRSIACELYWMFKSTFFNGFFSLPEFIPRININTEKSRPINTKLQITAIYIVNVCIGDTTINVTCRCMRCIDAATKSKLFICL